MNSWIPPLAATSRNPQRKTEHTSDTPAIAQLVEHLTVDHCSNQMVPGSIPGGRTFAPLFTWDRVLQGKEKEKHTRARASKQRRKTHRTDIHTQRHRQRPRGPMDKASAYGAGDCRFESCRGHFASVVATQRDFIISGLGKPPQDFNEMARKAGQDLEAFVAPKVCQRRWAGRISMLESALQGLDSVLLVV
jgi:hypothetical protein